MESTLMLIFVIGIAVWCHKEGKRTGSRLGSEPVAGKQNDPRTDDGLTAKNTRHRGRPSGRPRCFLLIYWRTSCSSLASGHVVMTVAPTESNNVAEVMRTNG